MRFLTCAKENDKKEKTVLKESVLFTSMQFRQQSVQVQRASCHVQFTVEAWPFLLRSIAIEFDAIVVRVAQVNRFAYAMVRSAVNVYTVVEQPLERARKFLTVRIENGEMIQSGAPGRRLRCAFARPGVESNMMMITTR